jgi:hypothetical protein
MMNLTQEQIAQLVELPELLDIIATELTLSQDQVEEIIKHIDDDGIPTNTVAWHLISGDNDVSDDQLERLSDYIDHPGTWDALVKRYQGGIVQLVSRIDPWVVTRYATTLTPDALDVIEPRLPSDNAAMLCRFNYLKKPATS